MIRRKKYIILNLIFFVTGTSVLCQEQKIYVNNYIGKTIELDYDQNDITFEFTGIQLDSPESVKYQYILKGLHHDWVDGGNQRKVSFNDLPSGKFTFRVRASNVDGIWSDPIEMNLSIMPPWWWTGSAKISYLILFAGGIYTMYSFQLRRRLEMAEAFRICELDEVKKKDYRK